MRALKAPNLRGFGGSRPRLLKYSDKRRRVEPSIRLCACARPCVRSQLRERACVGFPGFSADSGPEVSLHASGRPPFGLSVRLPLARSPAMAVSMSAVLFVSCDYGSQYVCRLEVVTGSGCGNNDRGPFQEIEGSGWGVGRSQFTKGKLSKVYF